MDIKSKIKQNTDSAWSDYFVTYSTVQVLQDTIQVLSATSIRHMTHPIFIVAIPQKSLYAWLPHCFLISVRGLLSVQLCPDSCLLCLVSACAYISEGALLISCRKQVCSFEDVFLIHTLLYPQLPCTTTHPTEHFDSPPRRRTWKK